MSWHNCHLFVPSATCVVVKPRHGAIAICPSQVPLGFQNLSSLRVSMSTLFDLFYTLVAQTALPIICFQCNNQNQLVPHVMAGSFGVEPFLLQNLCHTHLIVIPTQDCQELEVRFIIIYPWFEDASQKTTGGIRIHDMA